MDKREYFKLTLEEQSLIENEKELQLEAVAVDLPTSTPQEMETDAKQTNEVNIESEPSKTGNGTKKEKKIQLKAKVGRPQKYKKDNLGKNIDKKKFTLEIDKKVYKALKRKKTEEDIAINIFVEDLLKKSIEEKYFKNVSV